MIRLATIIHRHEQLYLRKKETKNPTFKQIFDEYMFIEKVERELNTYVDNKEKDRR